MDHELASRDGLIEKYLLDELDPQGREEFEEHYFTCAVCADEVRNGVSFVETLKVVSNEARTADVPHATDSWMEAIRSWFRFPGLVPTMAAAMLAAVAIYQGAVTIPGLRAAPEAQIIASAALRPASRGAAQTITVPVGVKVFQISVDVNAPEATAILQCDFVKEGGANVTTLSTSRPVSGTLNFLLPAERFPPGTYSLIIAGAPDSTGRANPLEIDRYSFTVIK